MFNIWEAFPRLMASSERLPGEVIPPKRFAAERTRLLEGAAKPISHKCLREHAFFKGRDPKLLDVLLDSIAVQVFLPGSDVIREGEEGDCMYFMYRGEVEVLIGPSEKRVATLQDGSLFGEMALLGSGKRAATIRAVKVSDCRVINAAAFHLCLKRFPKERRYFDHLAQERLAEINKTKDADRVSTVTPKPPETSSPSYAPSSLLRLRKFKRHSNVGMTLGCDKVRGTTTSGAIKQMASRRSPSAPPSITLLTTRNTSSGSVDDASGPASIQEGNDRFCDLRYALDVECDALAMRCATLAMRRALPCVSAFEECLSQRRSSLPHSCKVPCGLRVLNHRRFSESDAVSNEAHTSSSGQYDVTSAVLPLPILPPSPKKLDSPSLQLPKMRVRFAPAAGGC